AVGDQGVKLASLKGGRDGRLVVVSKDLSRAVEVTDIAPTLQAALDRWDTVAPQLEAVYRELQGVEGRLDRGLKTAPTDGFDAAACAAPLPRAYHWADGSAYVNHV